MLLKGLTTTHKYIPEKQVFAFIIEGIYFFFFFNYHKTYLFQGAHAQPSLSVL